MCIVQGHEGEQAPDRYTHDGNSRREGGICTESERSAGSECLGLEESAEVITLESWVSKG